MMKKALKALQKAGCRRVYMDGSFVTEKLVPGDFDGCWDNKGVDLDRLDPVLLDFDYPRTAQKAKYGGELFFARRKADHTRTFLEFFQFDRSDNPKGIIAFDLSKEVL